MSMVFLPTVAAFDCSRSCPAFERRDVCRFSALLAGLGVRAVVNSHTVRVAVAFSNVDALRAAVVELGGQFIGSGAHELFERNAEHKRATVAGVAFRLPGWNYPLVATDGGQLAFDDYGGHWGNVADVDRLRAAYSANAAKLAADALGWLSERNADGSLVVFHPNGGTLTIDATGGVDANGFNGVGCHDAAGMLAAAIGRPVEFSAKTEFYAAEQRLTVDG